MRATPSGLRALGHLAEDCHRAVQTAFRGGQLVARLTPREIALRYTIGMYDDGLTP
jgi:hypothetical protein